MRGFAGPVSDPRASRIVLVGYRGVGKSSVARVLAQRLSWSFVDTDELVERGSGRSIAELFADEGEARFRELEHRALAEVLGWDECVVSVGGGAVERVDNRELIAAGGVCVWLRAAASELRRRLRGDVRTASQRPALSDAGVLAEIDAVLARREPLYQLVATLSIDTDRRSVEDVAALVIAELRRRGDLAP